MTHLRFTKAATGYNVLAGKFNAEVAEGACLGTVTKEGKTWTAERLNDRTEPGFRTRAGAATWCLVGGSNPAKA